MKQLWLGLGILAAILAASIGGLSLLHESTEQTAQLLARSRAAATRGADAEALALSRQAQESWERHEAFVDMVMSHEETDEIRREFSDLVVYAEIGKREEFLSCCSRLHGMVKHLTEMELPLWHNILYINVGTRSSACWHFAGCRPIHRPQGG